ncbi:MAG: ATP-binding protein, partial [Thermovirgaceae bacterium]|nr:ATP-binding protein [Thermovirgaceae bacterium]
AQVKGKTHAECIGPRIERLTEALEWLRSWNLKRVELSRGKTEPLPFFEMSEKIGLKRFEQDVLLILFMKNFDPVSGKLFQKLEHESMMRDGVRIGVLLEMLSPDFRTQMKNKAFFGFNGNLRKHDLIYDYFHIRDESTSVFDERICAQQRIVNFLMGDETLYNSALRCIRREEPAARLEQIVMPDDTILQIMEQVDAFRQLEINGASKEIDDFFGYGTGLAMLFHGPSGTGKTMLAHALARHMGVPIISVDLGIRRNISVEDIVQFAFREASLSGGVLFFDECDDVFEDDSDESRAMLVGIEKSRCVTILTTNQPMKLDPALDRRIRIKVPFPYPDESDRKKIWKKLIPAGEMEIGEAEIALIAKRYVFTGGIIKNAVLTALNLAQSRKCGLDGDLLKEASDIQADSIMERSPQTRVVRPEAVLKEFPFPRVFRERVERLKRSVGSALEEGRSAVILLRCGDIQTGAKIAEALAGDCGVYARLFDMRDVLRLRNDEEERDRVSGFPYTPFIRHLGRRTLSIIVDHFGNFDRFVTSDKDQGETVQELAGCFKSSSEIVFIVTGQGERIKNNSGIEFDAIIDIPHPPVLAQADAWRRCAGLERLSEDAAALLAEEYPMHLREIKEAVSGVLFEWGSESSAGASFADLVRKHLEKGRQYVPVLFGRVREQI